MYIDKLASQIKNDILSGLRGYHLNLGLNIDQLKDECVNMRLLIIKELYLQGILPVKDLLIAINCVDVDCESLERCKCKQGIDNTLVAHFLIPQLIHDFGKQAIEYIGSTDRMNPFLVVTSLSELEARQYRKRGKDKPYVWIDYAPNENGMLDCFIFNAPMILQISIVGIFKDPRQVEKYNCCTDIYDLTGADDNITYLTQLVKDRLVKEKIQYYRLLATPIKPNDQTYSP